jgi:hypothetical protein
MRHSRTELPRNAGLFRVALSLRCGNPPHIAEFTLITAAQEHSGDILPPSADGANRCSCAAVFTDVVSCYRRHESVDANGTAAQRDTIPPYSIARPSPPLRPNGSRGGRAFDRAARAKSEGTRRRSLPSRAAAERLTVPHAPGMRDLHLSPR